MHFVGCPLRCKICAPPPLYRPAIPTDPTPNSGQNGSGVTGCGRWCGLGFAGEGRVWVCGGGGGGRGDELQAGDAGMIGRGGRVWGGGPCWISGLEGFNEKLLFVQFM